MHFGKHSTCAVLECLQKARAGSRTCAEPTHCALEEQYNEANKAMFQLKARLEKHRIKESKLGDGGSTQAAKDTEGLDAVDGMESLPATEEISPESQSDQSGKIKAQLTRKRTHNEELCVACCGVILGRATFFGSEALNGVRVSHQKVITLQLKLIYFGITAVLEIPIPHKELPSPVPFHGYQLQDASAHSSLRGWGVLFQLRLSRGCLSLQVQAQGD